MNKPPRFCVGEEVYARYKTMPHTRTEILNSEFMPEVRIWYGTEFEDYNNVWLYQTAETIDDGYWLVEHRIDKLPPEDRISWEDTLFVPSNLNANTERA